MMTPVVSSDDLSWLSESAFLDHELKPRPFDTEVYSESPWRNIGIIGGGTAGYFAALAIQRAVPFADVTVIESSAVPIIGVGEATVPNLLKFLHRFLGIPQEEFYREVRPTWKLGIRFEWGQPEPHHFNAPFDWGANSVGVLGSLAIGHGTLDMTIVSMMMERGVVPIFRTQDGYSSLLHALPFAYHFDVHQLVSYLRRLAIARGIRVLDERIERATPRADRSGLESVRAESGVEFSYDLFIDCSGFRSLLLEQSLKVEPVSYSSNLFTDRALVFNLSNQGAPLPYTTATTMDNGWCWRIPQREEDHLGYVFSSAFVQDDEANDEVQRRFGVPGTRVIRFSSGRHREAWMGNVVGIGNSFAFVEPLESTGILMIMTSIGMLIDCWPRTPSFEASRAIYNRRLCSIWDGLRGFIATHYKFNHRLNTPFWQHARNINVGRGEEVVEAFHEYGPIRAQRSTVRRTLQATSEPVFYGLAGYDCVLMGQRVPTNVARSGEALEHWTSRRNRVEAILKAAVSHRKALEVVEAHPHFLQEIAGRRSWTQRKD